MSEKKRIATFEVIELYRHLTNVKQDQYTWSLIDVSCESARTARDLKELEKIIPKVRRVHLGPVEFPRMWIDDYVARSILTIPLIKSTIEDGFVNYDLAIDVTTARLDSLINYTKITFSKDAKIGIAQRRRKIREFVKSIYDLLISKRVLRLEGDKVLLETDSITELVKPAIEKTVLTSSYFTAITRRFLTIGVLSTLGELTRNRIKELIYDLNKIVKAWTHGEAIEKDVNAILNEYAYFLHVLNIDEWYVWSKFKALSKLLKEAQEIGIDKDVIKAFHDVFMNVRAFSIELLGRLIHVAELDIITKIKLVDLISKAINDIIQSGEYVIFQNLGLIVDSRTYNDIKSIVNDVATISRALDALAKIYDKVPIQRDNINLVEVLRQEVGNLADELYEKVVIPYDKFIRGGNKDLKAVLLQTFDLTGIVKYDIGKNVVEVTDPKALAIIAVLLGARPLTILLRK